MQRCQTEATQTTAQTESKREAMSQVGADLISIAEQAARLLAGCLSLNLSFAVII